jgi:hypothetical protein
MASVADLGRGVCMSLGIWEEGGGFLQYNFTSLLLFCCDSPGSTYSRKMDEMI